MDQEQTPRLPERPHRYADWPVQPYWPTFIEKLLLAIIDANAPPSDENGKEAQAQRQARLDAAIEALFRVPISSGPKALYNLPAEMDITHNKLFADSVRALEDYIGAETKTKPPSHRRAAQEAEHLAEGHSAEARTESLRRSVRGQPMTDYLSQVALFNYHEEEDDMRRDLLDVCQILMRWNVELSVDARKLGMASLWGKTPAE